MLIHIYILQVHYNNIEELQEKIDGRIEESKESHIILVIFITYISQFLRQINGCKSSRLPHIANHQRDAWLELEGMCSQTLKHG
jgi:hypothetical protein